LPASTGTAAVTNHTPSQALTGAVAGCSSSRNSGCKEVEDDDDENNDCMQQQQFVVVDMSTFEAMADGSGAVVGSHSSGDSDDGEEKADEPHAGMPIGTVASASAAEAEAPSSLASTQEEAVGPQHNPRTGISAFDVDTDSDDDRFSSSSSSSDDDDVDDAGGGGTGDML